MSPPRLGIGSRFEVNIDDLAAGGDGLTRYQGKVIFVGLALPGETAEVEIIEEKADYARARVLNLKNPSAERTQPRCKHFGICGGCQMQHLAYETQVEFKERWAKEKINRVQVKSIQWLPTVAAKEHWEYRERVQLHRGAQDKWGFHKRSSHEVVPLEECFLLKKGFLSDIQKKLKSFGKEAPERFEFHFKTNETSTVRTLQGLHMRSTHEAFSQIHQEQNEKLVEHVLLFSGAADSSMNGKIIWDLYAGNGNFSLPLAKAGASVVAVESNRLAIDDCQWNQQTNDIKNVRCVPQDVKDFITAENSKNQPELIILDPPRTGARELMPLLPACQKIIYVSCDAATLARDAMLLIQEGYRIHRGVVLDLFPQTHHVETVLEFLREVPT